MKKIITILLALTLIITSGVSADTTGLIEGMNVVSDLTSRAKTDYVRRDEFAYVISTLMGLPVSGPSKTCFSDVREDNVYGSAIATVKDGGMMNGVSEYEFAPDSTITLRDASVVFVRLLGYSIWADSKGGYPSGYSAVATSLKMFNKVSKPLDSMLTFGDLWVLCDRALETPVAESDFTMSDGQITEEIKIRKNSLTLLEKNLGYTRYKAIVEEIIGENYSVRVTITENDERGNAKYGAGKSLTLKAASAVNIFAFDKAPVYIWINDKDELMHISTVENCEIIYASVYSVNRDYNANSKYNSFEIREMAFWDVEGDFKIHEDGAVFYHNDVRVNGKIHLTDKYVRAIITDGRITAVETWDFKDGGIVTESNYRAVIYTKGDATEAINGLGEYNREILILNGELRDIKELKPDTLIDYYVSADKETLIILASERKHTDIFEGYSSDEIQIGSATLKTADTVYTYSKEKGIYTEGNIADFVGTRISANVDAFGKVRYIGASGDITRDSFIGYVVGTKTVKGIEKSREALVINIDDEAFPSQTYKISDKAVYVDVNGEKSGTDALYSLLTDNSDTGGAKSVYRFKLNGKNEITRVTSLSPYFGYTTDADGFATASVSGQFPQNGDPTYFTINSKRLYLSRTEKITVLYTKDGEVAFGTTDYATLEAKHTSGTYTISFFGEHMSSEFDLILLSGDVANMSSEGRSFGIVTSVRTSTDTNGETVKIAEINGTKYNVNDDDADIIEENMLVYYSSTVGGFTSHDIDIIDTLKVSGDLYEWEGLVSSGGNITLMRGTVEKIDSKRLFIKDTNDVIDAYFFDRNGCKYINYDEVSGRFEDGSSYDIRKGKDIVYIVTANGMVSTVFYVN